MQRLVTAVAGLLSACTSVAGPSGAMVPQAATDTVPVPADCTEPVYLMVWIENIDRSKSAAYGQALRQSRIVSRHGGVYLAVSPPALLLEGDWPADRGFVVERYPCRALFDAMWFSNEYQEVLKPLRDGSGDYTVALFDQWPPAPSTATSD